MRLKDYSLNYVWRVLRILCSRILAEFELDFTTNMLVIKPVYA